jgi:hypothetical protein
MKTEAACFLSYVEDRSKRYPYAQPTNMIIHKLQTWNVFVIVELFCGTWRRERNVIVNIKIHLCE